MVIYQADLIDFFFTHTRDLTREKSFTGVLSFIIHALCSNFLETIKVKYNKMCLATKL